jgi:hypothetical protein
MRSNLAQHLKGDFKENYFDLFFRDKHLVLGGNQY